jgi:hypothetical protein
MKRKIFILSVALLILSFNLFLMYGCGGGSGSNGTSTEAGGASGTVTDSSSGALLEGVTVEMAGKSDITGTDGVYTINNVAVGSQTITATKMGYQTHSGTVMISKGIIASHDIQLAVGDPSDIISPSVPVSLAAVVQSSSRVDLSWNASTDNIGVAGYSVYRDGTKIASIASTSYSDTGLSPSTQYCYTVSAFDAAANESAQGGQVCAVTTGTLTYNNFAASFFSSYCTRCHTSPPQNGAPFSLATYNDVLLHIGRVRARATVTKTMPPSAPFPSDSERNDLQTWIDDGAIEN